MSARLPCAVLVLALATAGFSQPFTVLDRFGDGETRGLAWQDYDQDGRPDLIACTIGYSRLFHNDGGGVFTLADSLGPDSTYGAAWGDYDNDGWPDLALTSEKALRIYHNQLGALEPRFSFSIVHGRGAAWADYDLDGWLDLAVGCRGDTNRLYRNILGDSLVYVPGAFGPATDSTVGVAWADFNLDGRPDLAVANWGQRKKLYLNQGSSFLETTPFDTLAEKTAGLAWADCNRDGRPDIAFANSESPSRLFRGRPDNTFEEVSGAFGAALDRSLGIVWSDFNQDGIPDCVLGSLSVPARVLYGDGLGGFVAASLPAGVDSCFGLAVADVNDDLRPDIAVARSGANRLVRNNQTGRPVLGLRLAGRGVLRQSTFTRTYSNRDGIGARVRLLMTGRDSLLGRHEIAAGGGYCSMSDPAVFCAADTGTYRLVVSWPRTHFADTLSLDLPYPGLLRLAEDARPPINPDSIISRSHQPSTWTANRVLTMVWNRGLDPGGSGVYGYSYSTDVTGLGVPDTIVELYVPDDSTTLPPLEDGRSWYFNLRTCDSVGNWSLGTQHRGPYWIDGTPPGAPVNALPASAARTNVERPLLVWHPAQDTLSHIRSYWVQVSRNRYFDDLEWEGLAVAAPETSAITTLTLAEGWKFWRVSAVDSAANRGPWSVPDSFEIDRKPPTVLVTTPANGATNVQLNVRVLATFSEPLDSATVTDQTFTVTGSIRGAYAGTVSRVGGSYQFSHDSTFMPYEQIACQLTTDIRDRAGNPMAGPYAWAFTTGQKLDTVGPQVTNISAAPNPTRGDSLLVLGARASDESSIVIRAEYFIGAKGLNGRGHPMAGDFNSTEVIVVDTVRVDTLALGDWWFYVHALDAADNWSRAFDSVAVRVSGPPGKPQLTIELARDTVRLGDTLSMTLRSGNEPLAVVDAWLEQTPVRLPVHLVAVDPWRYTGWVAVAGLETGPAEVFFYGRDSAYNDTTIQRTITVVAGTDLLGNVFAWPNPVTTGSAHVHYWAGNTGVVHLMVYTLAGHLVLERWQSAAGGRPQNIAFDATLLANGLYYLVLEMRTADNRVKAVRRAFAVAR